MTGRPPFSRPYQGQGSLLQASSSSSSSSSPPTIVQQPNATGAGSRMNRACLECRLAKFKCSRDREADDCQRCIHHGFDCVTVSHRRGRKPKSRLAGLDVSAVGPISHSKTSLKRTRSEEEIQESPLTRPSGSHSNVPSTSREADRSGFLGDDDGHGGAGIALELLRQNAPSGMSQQQQQQQQPQQQQQRRYHEHQQQQQNGRVQLTTPVRPPHRPTNGTSDRDWDLDRLKSYLVADLRRTQSHTASSYTLVTPSRNLSPRAPPVGRSQWPSPADPPPYPVDVRVKDQPKTLASILDPSDNHAAFSGSSPTADEQREDPVSVGTISANDAAQLYAYFLSHLNIWSAMLDVDVQTHDYVQDRSTFLYSVILFAAAKAIPWRDSEADSWDFLRKVRGGMTTQPGQRKTDEQGNAIKDAWRMMRDRLHAHAKDEAARSLIDGDRSVEAVQAFFFLATWKDIDDSLTHVQSGFAFRLALDMRLGDSCPRSLLKRPTHRALPGNASSSHEKARERAIQVHFRKRQRTFLQLFVQDRLQSIYYVSHHTIPVFHPLIRTAELWKDDPLHTANDSWCCAAVEIRKIQSRWQGILEDDSFARGYRPSEALITSIRRDLEEWQAKWSFWTLPRSSQRGVPGTMTAPERACRSGSMMIWANSLSLHLGCSILRQQSPEDGPMPLGTRSNWDHHSSTNQTRSRSTTPSGGPHLLSAQAPSVRFCIEAARGVLAGVLEIPVDLIRAIPDSLSLEAAHAAKFLTSMVCVCEVATLQDRYLASVMELCQRVRDRFEGGTYTDRDTIALHARFLDRLITAAREPAATAVGNTGGSADTSSEVTSGVAPSDVPSDVYGYGVHTAKPANADPFHPFGPFDGTLLSSAELNNTSLIDDAMSSMDFDAQAFLNSISETFF
ncbi:hypothetical protein BCV69DRAFT_285623 [Microstroma glucosiphilum]|uniref:Zn(2)-C6 fungal-type domain-containing protein n=1 Tax=Pseudomicrostroma glucosiphilum TaxID=1684307 RepID=A0A316TX47_9BASI|nr:hypothetical protein BCV69DRAFT_285623 [Pseudomicrostroma glucosiphilum]PWN18026.1 hypothetical protein BCV69DRAFT_285623 [Pseudomicrostroma glucosiphilum]